MEVQHVRNNTKFRQLVPLSDGSVVAIPPGKTEPIPAHDWHQFKSVPGAAGRIGRGKALVEIEHPEATEARVAIEGHGGVDLTAARTRAAELE